MRILQPLPSFFHSNSEIVRAPPIQRLPATPQRTGEGRLLAARTPCRVYLGNPDRDFHPTPQYGGGTGPERPGNSTMDRPIPMHRSPNRLGVHETMSKH